jgi:hypothetical protein
MTDVPIDERRFTDEEVREILKKAVEKSSSRALTRKPEGLSLAELKVIGEEVGIDPSRLEDAARSVALGGANQTNALLGGPTVVNFERTVEVEFDPKQTPEILSVIRRTMGQQGEVDEIHGSIEWRTKGDLGERYITISPREGSTAITGSANLTIAAVVTYLPAGIVGATLSFAALIASVRSGSLPGLIFVLTMIPVFFGVLRTVYGRISEAQSGKLNRVVDELAGLISKGDE